MRHRLLVDTGFFFALYNDRDSRHRAARMHQHWLEELPIVLPWPILYETVNTRLARRRHHVAQFDAVVSGTRTTLLDDTPYRAGCYRTVSSQVSLGVSLVDAVLQSVIEDTNVDIGAMLTFNARDFAALCAENQVEILC